MTYRRVVQAYVAHTMMRISYAANGIQKILPATQ